SKRYRSICGSRIVWANFLSMSKKPALSEESSTVLSRIHCSKATSSLDVKPAANRYRRKVNLRFAKAVSISSTAVNKCLEAQ
ncbi:MAG: hypothetical protein PHF22_07230, partial [Sulfuricurvum sp.]